MVKSTWSFDPSGLEIEEELAAACDLRFDVYDDTKLEALNAGLWWVLPIARNHASQLIGLRLWPGRALAESAVVVSNGSEAVTLCSRPAALVPRRLFDHMASGAERWREVSGWSEAQWAKAAALHRALGGDDELAALRAVAADGALAARLRGDADTKARARGEGYGRIDPAPETAAYYGFAAEVAVALAATKPMPEVGAWSQALAALAFWGSGREPKAAGAAELRRAAAWKVMEGPPALDTSRSGGGMTIAPSADLAPALVRKAASFVVAECKAERGGDPRWAAIEAVARGGGEAGGYDGGEHGKAAAALEAGGDVEGAYAALTAAAYWSYYGGGSGGGGEGEARGDALDAAISLAQRMDGELGAVLERQRELWREL